jgi:hypothetical protein
MKSRDSVGRAASVLTDSVMHIEPVRIQRFKELLENRIESSLIWARE